MGMGFDRQIADILHSNETHPHPNPPLEGAGTYYSHGLPTKSLFQEADAFASQVGVPSKTVRMHGKTAQQR